MVERLFDVEKVTGSNPVPPTNKSAKADFLMAAVQDSKAELSEGEGGGVAQFFSRKICVTESYKNYVKIIS